MSSVCNYYFGGAEGEDAAGASRPRVGAAG
jgi:hypothetical protein